MMSSLRLSLRAVVALGLLVLSSVVAPAASMAAPASATVTYNVNNFNDGAADFTSDPGFTVCHTSPINNTCTLRAAIMNANRHGGSASINLQTGLYLLSTLPSGVDDDASGNLNINHTVTLAGAGAANTIVDAGGIDGVFFLTSTAVVTMTGLTIQHGNASDGGAIFNDAGQLSLYDTMLSGNRVVADGGGLLNIGTAIISHSTIANNIANTGGAIHNFGTLTVDHSTLDHNIAFFGGAIENEGGLTLFDSTISNNSAVAYGGGVDNLGTATANFYHVTIAGNLADSHGFGHVDGGGFRNTASAANVQLYNTLLADNYVSHTISECAGSVTSQDYNLIQTTAGCPTSGNTADNVINIPDALLRSLANNGGGTQTRALLAGSPALDQIPAIRCQDQFGTAPVPDQRGVARPIGPKCDIGAYEGAPLLSPYFRNLIFNGDAESSAGSPTGTWVGVAGWNVIGQFTAVPYNSAGGFPSVPTDTVPADRGTNFFAGGNITESVGYQLVSLPPIYGSINAGAVRYMISADLGGFASQSDNGSVLIRFEDGGFSPVGAPVTLGPVSALQRGNKTGFVHQVATGFVPADAVFANIDIFLTRTSGPGTYNDGYADNVSLVLQPKHTLFLPDLFR